MPCKIIGFHLFLGILSGTILLPGTSTSPTLEQSEESPYLIYGMIGNIRSSSAKEGIACSPPGTEEVLTPYKVEKKKARGLTCIGHDNITVPLLNRRCTAIPSKLTVTVNKDEDAVIDFKDDMETRTKEMFWGKEPLEKRLDSIENIRRTEDEKMIVPVNMSRESGFYSLAVDEDRGIDLNSFCSVALIRRECPANRYGEDCSGWCPDCMYGGVCHDKTGICVCPPGRKGVNCEEACEGGTILNECSVAPPATRNVQICLPSPYGCSCPPGYKGYSCNEGCDSNHWGVNCLETCNHCYSNECDPKTGKCNGPVKPCAGSTRGYQRFRQQPGVKLSPNEVEISFVHDFDGDEPDAEEGTICYRVVVWKKGEDMSNFAFQIDLLIGTATSVIVPVKMNLELATDYFAAVLVLFKHKVSGDTCIIRGQLRGERIQTTHFTSPCPIGKVTPHIYDTTQDSFRMIWDARLKDVEKLK